MRDLSLFAGAGGGILAGEILGWRTVAAVEIDAYCRGVLATRFPQIELHADIRTFDARPYRGRIDIVSGGFPCQGISAAGLKRGLGDRRSGLWSEFARVLAETEPTFAFVENSPRLRTHGLDRVLGDLAGLGYDATWANLRASAVGAPHHRDRMWVLAAHADRFELWVNQQRAKGRRDHIQIRRHSESRNDGTARPMAHADGKGQPLQTEARGEKRHGPRDHGQSLRGQWWAVEPGVGRVAHGLAAGMDELLGTDVTLSERLRALGNGQVPLVAACAFSGLYRRFAGE